jgi:hypothetical protein
LAFGVVLRHHRAEPDPPELESAGGSEIGKKNADPSKVE